MDGSLGSRSSSESKSGRPQIASTSALVNLAGPRKYGADDFNFLKDDMFEDEDSEEDI